LDKSPAQNHASWRHREKAAYHSGNEDPKANRLPTRLTPLVSIGLIEYGFEMQNEDTLRDQPALLKEAGLRLTRQRQMLAALLFDGQHKHVTAEQLHAAAQQRRLQVSLATVYNALHQFTDAGLLRKVVVGQDCVYFDTNTAAHHHFFEEESGHLTDVPASAVGIAMLPPPPAGRKVTQVDVMIRLSPIDKPDC
jgi:Fur family transcriptional regulator, iron response regulator